MSLMRKSAALFSAGVLALGLVACSEDGGDGGSAGDTIRMG